MWLTLVLAWLAAPSFDDQGGGQGIVGGAPTSTDPAVVALATRDVCRDTREVYCTGTLIAPRVVLTAAHCVNVAVETVELFFGDDTSGEGVWLRAAALRAAPGFDPLSYDDDIGAVILGEDAPVEPAPLWSAALGQPQVGVDARVVGFGVTEAELAAVGQKRSGLMQVSSVGASSFETTPNPAMSCQVDSGGPVLLVDEQGQERVAGITSTGDAFCEQFAVNTRVDAYFDAVLVAVLDEAASGQLTVPPPPSSEDCPGCSVLGCGDDQVCDAGTDACVPAEVDEARGCSSTSPRATWLLVLPLLLLGRRRRALTAE